MLLTPHAITGMAVGASVQNPALAVPIAFVLHFLGDMVPHWDFFSGTTKEEKLNGWRPLAIMADVAIGVFIGTAVTLYTLWVAQDKLLALNIFLCGIAAVLPDALVAPVLYTNSSNGFMNKILSIQRKFQFDAPLPWGAITQFLVVLASFLLISNSLVQ